MSEPERELAYGDAIDRDTFDQILEMDDEDEPKPGEFSRGIVFGFFDQAEKCLDDMNEALKARNLEDLSALGHFLKGSSATLGLTHLKDSCEKIQHYGKRTDRHGDPERGVSDDEYLRKIRHEYEMAKEQFEDVKVRLEYYYGD